MHTHGLTVTCWLLLVIAIPANIDTEMTPGHHTLFSEEIIDAQGVQRSWGKAVGDINGDGRLDLIVGGHVAPELSLWQKISRKLGLPLATHAKGQLVWYENPDWQKHIITEQFAIRTDIETGDINGDGKTDIVILSDDGVFWLNNGTWDATSIAPDKQHDLELADLDADGDLDIVTRNQTLFGYLNGNQISVFWQQKDGTWTPAVHHIDHGEGLKVRDMDRDGLPDIVVNRYWLKNTAQTPVSEWPSQKYTRDWTWDDVFIDTADFNGDGVEDIVLAPAEPLGKRYQIAWFEAPTGPEQAWQKHIVDNDVETIHHFVAARDMDRDGRIDVITSEMNQGEDPDEVNVYLHQEDGQFVKHVLGTQGSHSMRMADLDHDFDPDLFGANWQKEQFGIPYPVSLWRNQSANQAPTWTRHVIDADRPGQATFVFAEDMDGDGKKDIVTGAYWYRQPTSLSGRWQRRAIGERANNTAWLHDFDRDGDIDVLASGWIGYHHQPTLYQRILNRLKIQDFDYAQAGNQFVLGENDGKGNFRIHRNMEPADGDFLQGVALMEQADRRHVILSWHATGKGLQALRVPDNPMTQTWQWQTLAPFSQNEDLSLHDLNRDGRMDIVTGTRWLQQMPNDTWQIHVISDTKEEPDRNRIADINADGRPDVVVGFQAISKTGRLVWYEHPAAPDQNWIEHLISADLIGPMSLSVADMDGDNDLDVMVGEHNLAHPELARLVWLEQVSPNKSSANNWRPHLIYQGDEHHDGALVTDIDTDGDLDVVSIGWSHGKVLVYEQPSKPSVRGQ